MNGQRSDGILRGDCAAPSKDEHSPEAERPQPEKSVSVMTRACALSARLRRAAMQRGFRGTTLPTRPKSAALLESTGERDVSREPQDHRQAGQGAGSRAGRVVEVAGEKTRAQWVIGRPVTPTSGASSRGCLPARAWASRRWRPVLAAATSGSRSGSAASRV
jgi:hypothetical protein